MPITVQHQPSLAKLGQLAYRTGQLQYSDRRRQEEEARLMKERQMAMQQQQFGQKMAFDVWNRQFGQAGAMQQLMVQNQIQAQRDQRQQQFMMNRIDVGHQNNLALDDINNMQQMDRDNRLQEWRGKEQKLLQEQQLAKEIRAQDAAEDANRNNYQFRLDSAGHQNAIKNLSPAGQEAYIAEMRTGTELQNQQSEMAPDEYEQQQTAHQERLRAVSANHEYQLKMMKAVPNHPGWYQPRLENGEYGDPALNLEEVYPEEKDDSARRDRYMRENTFTNPDTGQVWVPDMKTPGGGSYVTPVDPTAVKSAEFASRTKPITTMLDNSQKHLAALLKAQSAAEFDQKPAFNDDIAKAQTSVEGWQKKLNLAYDEMYPGSREPPPPPELEPPSPLASMRGRGEGGALIGEVEELLGGMNVDQPADQGQQLASGGAVTPPPPLDVIRDDTGREINRGSYENPIIARGLEEAMKLSPGQWAYRPIVRDGVVIGWKHWERGNTSPMRRQPVGAGPEPGGPPVANPISPPLPPTGPQARREADVFRFTP